MRVAERGRRTSSAVALYVIILVAFQVFLLTVAVEAFHTDDESLAWATASVSVVLAAVAAFGLARSGQVLLRATVGMALGFAYFVADNFSLAMGNVGAYPPIIAAWAPFFLFLLIGETVLIRSEE